MNRPITLEPDHFFHLHGAACLQVASGTIWLTIDGEPDDRLLSRGDRVSLPQGVRALVQALDAPAGLVLRQAPGRVDTAWQALREMLLGLHHALAPRARLL